MSFNIVGLQASIAAGMEDDFCGTDLIVGIKSRYPLQTETNLTSSEFMATSLAILIHQGKTVAIIGTEAGHILKVSLLCLLCL